MTYLEYSIQYNPQMNQYVVLARPLWGEAYRYLPKNDNKISKQQIDVLHTQNNANSKGKLMMEDTIGDMI